MKHKETISKARKHSRSVVNVVVVVVVDDIVVVVVVVNITLAMKHKVRRWSSQGGWGNQ